MVWWAKDFAKACPQAKNDAIMALYRRAKKLEGKAGNDSWLMGELQRHTVKRLDKVDPQVDEGGEQAWIRLLKEAMNQVVVDSKQTMQATSKLTRKRNRHNV